MTIRWYLLVCLLPMLVPSLEGAETLRGPIKGVLQQPFVVIYPEKTKENFPALQELLTSFIKELPSQACQRDILKAEEKVGEEDIESKNLVLLTLFRDSALLNKIKDNLPIRIEDDEVILDKRIYKGDVGLVCIVPNLLNPRKYLAIFGATTPKALSHILDFKPYYDDPVDYFLYTVDRSGLALKVEAGTFEKRDNEHWSLYRGPISPEEIKIIDSLAERYKNLGAINWVSYLMACFPQEALIVYGTHSSSEEENEYTQKQALLKQEEVFAKRLGVKIEAKADKDVDEKELREKNLMLFGTPTCNSILAKVKDKLPIKFKNKFVIARFPYTGEWTGITLACPNPFNPERFLIVYSGVSYKGIHYFAWAGDNDYVIYRNSPIGPHGEAADTVLETGILDKSDPTNWKL